MDLLEHVAKDLGKGKTTNIVIGLIVIAFGIAGLFIPASEEDIMTQYILCAAFIIFGITFFFAARKKMPKNNKLYKALTQEPEKIKQVYIRRNILNGLHNSTVLDFVFVGGGLETIQIPKEEEELYMAKAKELLPNAEFGYVDPLKKQEK